MSTIEEDALRGLTAQPKDIPPKWFYDDRGSDLFDAITRVEEYYPTRRERAILETRAPEIALRTEADTLVELGSGTSEKTRVLLDGMRDASTLRRYVPFDVSKRTLHDAAAAIEKEYAGIDVQPVVGDFTLDLDTIPRGGRRLVVFLGGTIGNLLPERAPSSCATSRQCSIPATTCCSVPTSSRSRRGSSPRTTTPRASRRSSTRTCCT